MICSPRQSVSLVNHLVQLTSYPETIEEEGSEVGSPDEEDPTCQMDPGGKAPDGGLELPNVSGKEQPPAEGASVAPTPLSEDKDAAEIQKRRRLEQAGIKVMPAAQRFARLALLLEGRPHQLSACPQVWNLPSKLDCSSYCPASCLSHCITLPYSEQREIDNSFCPRARLCQVFGYFKWR